MDGQSDVYSDYSAHLRFVQIFDTKSYSVDIFSYSGPSGILGSDGKQEPIKLVLGVVRIVAISISSHEQTQ